MWLGLMLDRLALIVYAAVLEGLFLDRYSPFNDGGVTPEVGMIRPFLNVSATR